MMRRTIAFFLFLGAIGSLVVVRVSFAQDSLPPPPLLWLPSQLRIVDVDIDHGERLALPLREMGFGVQVLDVETPTSGESFDGVWWITNEAAQQFPAPRARSILTKHGRILLDGISPLSQDVLGARERPEKRRAALMGETSVNWDEDIPVITVDPSPTDRILATTADPVLVNTATISNPKPLRVQYPALIRRGSLLWSMPRLDRGAELRRLPYLSDALRSLGVEPAVERRDIELYVDPDLEFPNSPDILAEKWRTAGVKRVYLAAWKEDRLSGYRYPYDGFITAMHERNIEVFAWVEWPHINSSFWREHPECRELTATGQPAHIFWRESVAIEVPACFDQAWSETSSLLTSFAFDGVNLVELYFDSPESGPRDPSSYTPFHPVARAEFRKQNGFDPKELMDPSSLRFWERDRASFDAWVNWRTAKARELHEQMLTRTRSLKRIRNVMVTIIDDRYADHSGQDAPAGLSLARNIGADSRQVLSAMQGTSDDIQIEDASELWGKDPRRYNTFSRLYPEIPTSALVIDLNVVERLGSLPSDLTTKQARGFELGASVAAIGSTGGRLALYASSTIATEDFPWIKFALAAGSSKVEEVSPGQIRTHSSVPFFVRVVRPAHRLRIDGRTRVYGGLRSIPVPAGDHVVEFDPPDVRSVRR